MSLNSLDDVISLATGAQGSNSTHVANAFKALVRKDKDGADIMLSGASGSGQDPLAILAPNIHTLPYLYILSARLATNATTVTHAVVENFCRTADPIQLRLAPDRVTLLAHGISRAADQAGSIRTAIGPLRDLVRRFPATPAHLTSVHPIFVHACVKSHYFTLALPVLQQAITEIDKNTYDLTYHTSLNYHYSAGICLAALKRFREAEEFLEIVVSSPSQGPPTAVQLDALNKLALIQLIIYGKTNPTPKYTHATLGRIFKVSPYSAFTKVYPAPTSALVGIVEKDLKTFSSDNNLGLVKQALQRAPRWAVRKLTETYVTLALPEIGKAVGIESEAEVRTMVLSMIEAGEINATLSAEGTVTFLDPPTSFTKEGIDALLEDAQTHAMLLVEFDRELERSRDFLQKAVRDREGGGPWMMEDMDMTGHSSLREAIWDEGDF
ncbi:hypothetical protein EXIGLDRAFT_725837 [Exidia glandulosa HHB12029]|uniref:COP9 signalosome complex subunit 3 n=1 Tax=Exidia glandulosa HHB12029 TaxID=1314781 RepID=A0A165MFT3_EXIGL|nr:hypothetical protein EXIGLDRAFT_725837 [Exidia glandulosa HHB12029]